MKIVLVGYMGSGKTTIGKLVAKALEFNFLDLDEYIEKTEKKSVSDIFSEKGEVYFRKMENFYLNELLAIDDDLVLSVGGGTPCFGSNMQDINKATLNSFYIRVSISDLTDRLVSQKAKRPLIAHLSEDELPEFIAKHLFERSYFYNQAHKTVYNYNKTPDELKEEILKLLV
ncbi:shikimate kinase [Maribacter sp. CXY002]|uniref:shikimate kinase n=1 Tax=Maribacter luteocoastalis TaxID=3407671 RepID=UPI003B6857ED